MIDKLAERWYG